MSFSSSISYIGQDSTTEIRSDHNIAGLLLSFAPSLMQSLKTSVSTLTLGTIVTTSVMGGGSIFSSLLFDY